MRTAQQAHANAQTPHFAGIGFHGRDFVEQRFSAVHFIFWRVTFKD
jgi:hypothetical protein